MRRMVRTTPGPSTRTTGVTLTEVLMSVLVMGIGVLSVITLFPISFLRSVQATNLTNATILRYNAESQIDLNRVLVDGVPQWQPNTAYAVGDEVVANPLVPTNPQSNNRLFRATNGGTSFDDPPGQPTWDIIVGNTTNDNGITWETVDHSVYVIDPLGWNLMGALQNEFGNDAGAVAADAPTRFNVGFINDEPGAARFVRLPDSWIHITEAVIGAATPTSVDLLNTDLSDLSLDDPVTPADEPASRIVLLDDTGRNSIVRRITSFTFDAPTTTTTLNWDEPVVGFTATSARVETEERRYTWMLTVRRLSDGTANINVVVFFRRNFAETDEEVFDVLGAGANINQLELDGPVPNLRKGGFLFDVVNGRWYRIQELLNEGTNRPIVTLDQAPVDPITRVIIMRGIVDVYPIKTRPATP